MDQSTQSLLEADHYEALGVSRSASTKELRNAFFMRARALHPDKGGTTAAFARIQESIHVLADPQSRKVYDQLVPAPSAIPIHPWPTSSRHRTQVLAKAQQHPLAATYDEAAEDWGDRPGMGDADIWGSKEDGQESKEQRSLDCLAMRGAVEGAMLEMLTAQGLECNPSTQLVVTCEVCLRPATRKCSACEMAVCELCTRRMHAKGAFGLHWPVVVSPGSLSLRIAKQEMERKHLCQASDQEKEEPSYVAPAERAFQERVMESAVLASVHPSKLVRYDPDLAFLYMWTQTDFAVYLAVHIPTGRPDIPAVVHMEEVASSGAGGSGLVLSVGPGQQQQQQQRRQPGQPGATLTQGEAGLRSKLDLLEGGEGMLSRHTDKEDGAGEEEEDEENGMGVDDASDCAASSSVTDAAEVRSASEADQQQDPLQQQGERPLLPVLERKLWGGADPGVPMEVTRTEDNRFVILAVPKASPGATWQAAFEGDAAWMRYAPAAGPSLYRMEGSDPDEVTLEIDVPPDTQACDVVVHITHTKLSVQIKRRGREPELTLLRTFRVHDFLPDMCTWSLHGSDAALPHTRDADAKLSSQSGINGKMSKTLNPTGRSRGSSLKPGFLPPPPDKDSRRKHNLKVLSINLAKAVKTDSSSHGKGLNAVTSGDKEPAAVFLEDEDRFGLTNILRAAVFRATGQAFVGSGLAGRWTKKSKDLPQEVQTMLQM